MTPKSLSQAKSQELRLSLTAMRRAARIAREVAIRTETAIVIQRGQTTVRLTANELREAPSR